MSAIDSKMKLQMQPLLSDLHRFMAKCVKSKKAYDGSDLMLILPSTTHNSGLKYFGQSKVEATVCLAEDSASTKANRLVTIPIAKGQVAVPLRSPSSGDILNRHSQQTILQKTDNDLLTQMIDQVKQNSQQNVLQKTDNDLLSQMIDQVKQNLQDLVKQNAAWDETPTHSVYDMYKNLSPKNGILLPATLPASWKSPPGLEPVAPELLDKIKIVPDQYNSDSQPSSCDSQPSTCDSTPVSSCRRTKHILERIQ